MSPSNPQAPTQSQQTTTTSVSPQTSASPLISSEQRRESAEGSTGQDTVDPQTGKRRLFGLLGKKKGEEKDSTIGSESKMETPTVVQPSPIENKRPAELKSHPQPIAVSPNRFHSNPAAASPSHLRSASPRLNSPASSEIFERSVQEPIPISTLSGELSPAHMPTHVITEDHIPPALEASVQAITSEELNPDEVEIVTSSSHQPAGASVLESSASQADLTSLNAHNHSQRSDDLESSVTHSGFLPSADEEGASNYGSLDPNDVRRLSFISFADVVQSEHQHPASSVLGDFSSRDSLHVGSLSGSLPTSAPIQDRTASPLLRSPRSPASSGSHPNSGGPTTPPHPGMVRSALNNEQSPVRSVGLSTSNSGHGELTIETMRQAVRKTASGDLGQSYPMSPVTSNEDGSGNRSRTNT